MLAQLPFPIPNFSMLLNRLRSFRDDANATMPLINLSLIVTDSVDLSCYQKVLEALPLLQHISSSINKPQRLQRQRHHTCYLRRNLSHPARAQPV